MNKQQRFSVLSVSLSALAVWFFIITQVQPNKNDPLMLLTFFASLIIWLGSAIAYMLYTLRVRKSNREIIYAYIQPSIRQGFLASGTVAILLFLQMLRVLSIWDAVLVFGVGVLFELALSHTPHKMKVSR